MDDPTSHMQEEDLRVSESATAPAPVENKDKEKIEKERKEREEEEKKKITPELDIEDESENDDPTGIFSYCTNYLLSRVPILLGKHCTSCSSHWFLSFLPSSCRIFCKFE